MAYNILVIKGKYRELVEHSECGQNHPINLGVRATHFSCISEMYPISVAFEDNVGLEQNQL